jgi:SAM-dependent methyltransferase
MRDTVEARQVARLWEHTHRSPAGPGIEWQDLPPVRRRINRMVSGSPDEGWLDAVLRRWFPRLPLERCLSLACGTGEFERDLARRGVFRRCDAFDLAEGALETARARAGEAGLAGIHYFLGDMNRIELAPGTYDAVWSSAAVHHCQELEHLFAQVRRALKPGGLFVMDEYVGPSRFQFSPERVALMNAVLGLLPARYRCDLGLAQKEVGFARRMGFGTFLRVLLAKLRHGRLREALRDRARALSVRRGGAPPEKHSVRVPDADAMRLVDPSEAARSAEIVPLLGEHFQVLEQRGYGGALLYHVLHGIAGNFDPHSPVDVRLLDVLFAVEDALLETGELQSDFAVIVARRRN